MTFRRLRAAFFAWLLLAAVFPALAVAAVAVGDEAFAVEGTSRHPLAPPDTSSPRATLGSFLTDANAAWRAYLESGEEEEGEAADPARHVRRAVRTIDLSQVAPVQRDEVGTVTLILLLDVFNRIALPSPKYLPDAAEMEQQQLTRWVIPNTGITIAQVKEGPRKGEWLFTPEVITGARGFYRRTRSLPLKPGAVVEDGFAIYVAIAGWMIPVDWIDALPNWAHEVYGEQTVWQWVLFFLVLDVALLAAWLGFRWSRRAPPGERPPARRALAAPLTLILVTGATSYLVEQQIHITGKLAAIVQVSLNGIFFLAAAWSVVLVGSVIAQTIVSSPRIQHETVNAHMIRVGARILSFSLAVLIVVEGARSLGIPVVGVMAGLGVGGLAIALAAQPTIENFIAGLTLFADRPVGIGDFCRFGEQLGTVEEIGLRSTRVRTLERSLLTIPNAEFSRLQLDNLTHRDRILFRSRLNLRLETTAEQLERVLSSVRELLLGDDRIDEDPARVRLVAVGPHSLDLEVFAYVKTRDWNTFLGIQEELYMGILRVIEEAGTALAPPAHTTYLRSDAPGPSAASPGGTAA
jgi:MscS family membrane protein